MRALPQNASLMGQTYQDPPAMDHRAYFLHDPTRYISHSKMSLWLVSMFPMRLEKSMLPFGDRNVVGVLTIRKATFE